MVVMGEEKGQKIKGGNLEHLHSYVHSFIHTYTIHSFIHKGNTENGKSQNVCGTKFTFLI